MNKVLCFGELLMRLSPAAKGQWIEDHSMAVYLGGAELNVASALAQWQQPVRFCTALPAHALSDDICSSLKEKGFDISAIHSSGHRIGIYYLPQGKDLKHEAVIYDRANSSFASLTRGMIDWETILAGVDYFHFSAISPAVSAGAADVCLEGLQAAAKKNIPISIDLNYRARLWQYGKQPVEIMQELVSYCTIIMGNIWSSNSLLGAPLDKAIHDKYRRETYLHHADETAAYLLRTFKKCTLIAQTFRFDTEDGIQYYASINDKKQQYSSADYSVSGMVDKVGSGDCFMAALIYGLIRHYPPQYLINFAAAAATGKMKEKGDATSQTIESIEKRIVNL